MISAARRATIGPVDQDSENRVLRAYHLVEQAVSALVLLGMVVVVAFAVWSFFLTLWTLGYETRGTLDYAQFQTLFDRVLAAVIALELARSIGQLVAGEHGLRQVRTVIVIGMLAVVRKLIVLEVDQATGPFLLGIAAAVVGLAVALLVTSWVERRPPDPEG